MPKTSPPTPVSRTEVADRLLAVGTLGGHVAAGRIGPAEAIDVAVDLIAHALMHCEGVDG